MSLACGGSYLSQSDFRLHFGLVRALRFHDNVGDVTPIDQNLFDLNISRSGHGEVHQLRVIKSRKNILLNRIGIELSVRCLVT